MEEPIPLKKLVMSEEGGIKTIAFVDQPAIMVNWVAFNEQKEIKVCFANEDKGIILSPLLISGLPIPRIHPITKQPFAVVMDAETISEVHQRWSKEMRQNLANEMHDGKQVDGINWYASFQSDGVNIMNPPAFSDLPPTLFVMGKIDNPEIKAKIKDGTYKGISMEGFFDMIDFASLTVDQVWAITENILGQEMN